MLWRLAPWAAGVFLAFVIIKSLGPIGHFFLWLLLAGLRLCWHIIVSEV